MLSLRLLFVITHNEEILLSATHRSPVIMAKIVRVGCAVDVCAVMAEAHGVANLCSSSSSSSHAR
jgi:hypothetical protein